MKNNISERMVESRVPRDRNRNLTRFPVVSGLRTAGDSRPYRLVWLVGLLSFSLFANTPPEITNVRASQRENTKLVDIYYDAVDADGDLLKVRIEISDNDGLKYSVPAFSLTGDIGEGVAQGFPGLEWGNEVPPGGFLMGQDGGAEGSGLSNKYMISCWTRVWRRRMDRNIVKKTTFGEQDEAFCLTLTLDERLRVLEELNRQGRIMAGYPASLPMDRTVVRMRAL